MRKQRQQRSVIQGEQPFAPDLAACTAGDEQAWEQLLRDYGGPMRKAIRWTLQHSPAHFAYPELEAEVEDVCQEVCFRMVRSEYKLLRTYDSSRGSFATWLCVVARSTALDHLRNRKYAVQMTAQELEAVMEAHEDTDGMLSLPREVLSPRQRYVLHLAFEQDATTKEIAALMDVHPQTVRSIRNAALARLRWHYFGAAYPKDTPRMREETQSPCKVM